MTFREKYIEEMNDVSFSEGFEIRTLNLMKQRSEGKDEKALKKRKPTKVLVLVFAIIALLSATVFAVSYLLSAREVAEYLGEKELAEMFKDSECEPVTATNGIYDVIFLGKATGDVINAVEGFECDEARTYAVIAIRSTDGTPLYLVNGIPIVMAPVIEGFMPFQSWAVLNIGARGLERDGILYYLFDYENLEIFGDRTVSIAIFEGAMFPGPEILTMDENGQIVYNDEYSGIKGLFELPMDESKADPEAAAELIGSY